MYNHKEKQEIRDRFWRGIEKRSEIFCAENKIPKKYYKQRNTISVDFSQLESDNLEYFNRGSILYDLKEKLVSKPSIFVSDYDTLFKQCKFSPRQVKIAYLSAEEGYTELEIAEKLGLSYRTVKSEVSKIKKLIRKYLK